MTNRLYNSENINNTGKIKGLNNHTAASGVLGMPVKKSEQTLTGYGKNIRATRGTPQSDTANVKVTKDALTQAFYGNGE